MISFIKEIYLDPIFRNIIIISVALLIRMVIKNRSKSIVMGIWYVLVVMLIVPINISSINSNMMNNIKNIAVDKGSDKQTRINDNTSNESKNIISVTVSELNQTNEKFHNVIEANNLVYIWIVGAEVLFLLFVLRYIYFMFALNKIARYDSKKQVYVWDGEACLVGIINPKIVIPYNLDEQKENMILEHERSHLKRKDNVFLLLLNMMVIINWMNPMALLMYYCCKNDIEYMCDEIVLEGKSVEYKKKYARVLLEVCSISKKDVVNGFGGVEVKKRIHRIKKDFSKKTSDKFVLALAIIIIVAMAGVLSYKVTADKRQEKEFKISYNKDGSFDIESTAVDIVTEEINAIAEGRNGNYKSLIQNEKLLKFVYSRESGYPVKIQKDDLEKIEFKNITIVEIEKNIIAIKGQVIVHTNYGSESGLGEWCFTFKNDETIELIDWYEDMIDSGDYELRGKYNLYEDYDYWMNQ